VVRVRNRGGGRGYTGVIVVGATVNAVEDYDFVALGDLWLLMSAAV
jgi:hypothetical protein